MDLYIAVVTGAGTILCGVLVAIIFIFGFKEKTYEEALGEQRSKEFLALIEGDKSRLKKSKKSVKKAKQANSSSEAKPGKDHAQSSEQTAEKASVHVDFAFPEAQVLAEDNTAQTTNKNGNRGKKRSKPSGNVRSILHNKDEHSPLIEDSQSATSVANHFEEIHPKDDVLLKRHNSREDMSATPPPSPPIPKILKPSKEEPVVATKQNKQETAPAAAPKTAKINKAPKVPLVVNEQQNGFGPEVNEAKLARQEVKPEIEPFIKERKKKKGEVASLQQLSKGGERITMGLLHPLLSRAELSHSEVHELIEQLLTRQGGGDEWVGGRQDPTNRLKKQLADKEKAFAEGQEMLEALQTRLVQVRGEVTAERQRYRQLEEQLVSKQHEITQNQTRLQLANESSASNMKAAQQLQNQLAEERKRSRKLLEDHNAMAAELERCLQTNSKQYSDELASLHSRVTEQQELALSREVEVLNQIKCLELQLQQANAFRHSDAEKALEESDILKQRLSNLEAELQGKQSEVKNLNSQLTTLQQKCNSAPQESPELISKLDQLQHLLSSKEELLSTLQADKEKQKVAIEQLSQDLEAQRKKNDDLRTKNWEAMEAMASVERNSRSKQTETLVTNKTEEAAVRDLLQRILPAVPAPLSKEHTVWLKEFESSAQQWLSCQSASISGHGSSKEPSQEESNVLGELEKQNSQLQAMVTHYKSIIEDTEGMLNKLEQHVGQEETRWRRQIELKESEMESVIEHRDALLAQLNQADLQQSDSPSESS